MLSVSCEAPLTMELSFSKIPAAEGQVPKPPLPLAIKRSLASRMWLCRCLGLQQHSLKLLSIYSPKKTAKPHQKAHTIHPKRSCHHCWPDFLTTPKHQFPASLRAASSAVRPGEDARCFGCSGPLSPPWGSTDGGATEVGTPEKWPKGEEAFLLEENKSSRGAFPFYGVIMNPYIDLSKKIDVCDGETIHVSFENVLSDDGSFSLQDIVVRIFFRSRS